MIKKFKEKQFLILIAILLLAVVLRFVFVGAHDPYTDEVLLGFRAIGMIDYDVSLVQSTPWQWVDIVPGWMHLSFHDHPVLFFLAQHFSIRVFGENMLALRLPAVLAGFGSVFLIYLLAGQLINKKAGYISAIVLAVQSYHVWVSRLGIQDGLVIFFSLLILWLWMQSLEKDNKWLWILWGASLGLGIITKLTVVIIIPILFVYLLIFKINIFKKKFFWYGILSCVVISSPYWLYNLFLYKNFGHFDFQLSAFFNQNVEKWQFRQGRNMVGGLSDRIKFFFVAMHQSNSYLFNAIAILSFLYSIVFFIKKRDKNLIFLIFTVIFSWLWFLVIGSTLRFVVMIIPWVVLLASYFFSSILEHAKFKQIVYGFLVIFLSIELLFTINSFILPASWGKKNLTYAESNIEMQNFGFNEVDKYLNKALKNKVSAAFGQPEYQFTVDLHNNAIKKAKEKNYEPYPLIIIYDDNFNFLARLWVFQRRIIYRGWLTMSRDMFLDLTGGEMEEYYKKQGITDFVYFTGIKGMDFNTTHIYEPYKKIEEDNELVEYLENKGIKPEYIKNRQGQDAFRVYKF